MVSIKTGHMSIVLVPTIEILKSYGMLKGGTYYTVRILFLKFILELKTFTVK